MAQFDPELVAFTLSSNPCRESETTQAEDRTYRTNTTNTTYTTYRTNTTNTTYTTYRTNRTDTTAHYRLM